MHKQKQGAEGERRGGKRKGKEHRRSNGRRSHRSRPCVKRFRLPRFASPLAEATIGSSGSPAARIRRSSRLDVRRRRPGASPVRRERAGFPRGDNGIPRQIRGATCCSTCSGRGAFPLATGVWHGGALWIPRAASERRFAGGPSQNVGHPCATSWCLPRGCLGGHGGGSTSAHGVGVSGAVRTFICFRFAAAVAHRSTLLSCPLRRSSFCCGGSCFLGPVRRRLRRRWRRRHGRRRFCRRW